MVCQYWLVQNPIPKCNTWIWYIKCKKHVSHYLFDYRPKCRYCIFFKKTSPSFADLYVGITEFGKCCDVVLLGHMCKYIALWQKSNHYFECLYTGIANVGKINKYWSQMTIAWFTKHMIYNNHYIMLMFTSFTT